MTRPSPRVRIGVSTCLLGEKVRFDAGHKHDRFVTDTLGPHVEHVPVCPEMELGLGAPREAMRLEGEPDAPRLVTLRTGRDLTEPMQRFSERRVQELARQELDGYILKSKSPSCGMQRVKVYREPGRPPRMGRGVFAEALQRRLPHLPVEEEGRLNDPRLRERFIVRVFCHWRWRHAAREPFELERLVGFHTRHKLLLMSRSEPHMRELGRLVANGKRRRADHLFRDYADGFFQGMQRAATPRKHANVLQHIAGHLRGQVDAWDRRELARTIDRYRLGMLPLVVPITLLRHYIEKHGVPYAREQVYLYPHPDELMLLNHV